MKLSKITPYNGWVVEASVLSCTTVLGTRAEFNFTGHLTIRNGVVKVGTERVTLEKDHNLFWSLTAVNPLFKPEKNALKFICQICFTHPLVEALRDARKWDELRTTSNKQFRCSLCGRTRIVAHIPPMFWNLTTESSDEEVADACRNLRFDRLMRDYNETVHIFSIRRGAHAHPKCKYQIHAQSKSSTFSIYTDEYPTAEMWELGVSFKDLCEGSLKVMSSGQTLHEAEVQNQ